MKILILGGDGMLGHELLRVLCEQDEARVTLRGDLSAYQRHGLFNDANSYAGIDVRAADRLLEVISDFRPAAIVNAVGIVKQRALARESIPSLEVNSLLPHRLAVLAGLIGARLIHFSTDCVFSGRQGNYTESDTPDCEDLYGRTKLLGEVSEQHCLTLRSSIIGNELARNTSLVEWFFAQRGTIKGFRRAVYSGLTTTEMARLVRTLLHDHPTASGLYHVSSEAINKYELLRLIRQASAAQVEILPDDEFVCDRSMNSARFRAEFAYQPPAWETMVEEMVKLRSPT